MDAPKPVNSPSVQAHKRQFAWQILVPMLVVAALIVATAVLVAIGATATRTWADVSTIWLIAPLLVFALFFFIILGVIIYGMARLLQVIPRFTGKAQDFFSLLSGWVRKIADTVIKPVVWVRQAGAILNSIFKS